MSKGISTVEACGRVYLDIKFNPETDYEDNEKDARDHT